MGCCVSTHGTSTKHQNFQAVSESLKPNSTCESRAPPPSIEEETVKEVLSETPKLKPPPSAVPQLLQPIKNPQLELHHQETNSKKIHINPPFPDEKIKPNGHKNDEFIFKEKEISEQEVSEVCSLSFSETVSTTTFNNDKRDEDDDDGEEVKQRVKKSPVAKLTLGNKAVSGDFGPRRDRVLGKSPNRRIEQSPDKINNAGRGGGGSVRLVQSRESGTYQAGRQGLKPDANRRDPGEISGRRFGSPANNRSIMGHSPSTRRTNGSPSRARTDLTQSSGGGGGGVMECKWPCTSDTSGTSTTESLENPLVSLECFIFL
ncbi:hypothetical protein P3X46_033312 [Hevea brasiliensis]|uniref:DUF4005 domain-containing protein n=1 Tax=Hevea brasiliensis TaxID=3981 RepID=A0ABQ9KFY7_HEVBR|nr:uncharacterized protein LOC110670779 [Hevea brasiliensis]KAJ9136213.1 hypothetical protein P3X46_033312 [Hevea brasiliensis]